MRKIKVTDIYSEGGHLYDLWINRSRAYKMNEAQTFAAICHGLGPKRQPRSILEICGGSESRHAAYFQESTPTPTKWTTADRFADPATVGPNVLCMDLTEPFGQKFDAAFGFFYTGTIINGGPGQPPTRALLRETVRNVLNHLNPFGFILMDCSGGLGHDVGYMQVETNQDEPHEWSIYVGSPMRAWLRSKGVKVDDWEPCSVVGNGRSTFDRVLALATQTWDNLKVVVNGKAVATLVVENPMYELYLGESDYAGLFMDAGASSLRLFSADYNAGHFSENEVLVDYVESAADMPITNLFMICK